MKTGPSKATMEKALAEIVPQSVIVYGPSGCGKSTNAERMRVHFGLANVVDDFDAIRNGCKLTGVLYLTDDKRVAKSRRMNSFVRVLDYHAVMADIDAASSPAPAEPTTLEKLIAHAPNLALTGWMPCTMQPVRDGRYQIELLGNDDGNGALADWKDGKWFWVKTGEPAGGPNGDLRENWMWRGVRRWVLQKADMYLSKRDMFALKWSGLSSAMGFDTAEQALAERDSMWPFTMKNVTAVLP